jgi:hypothetical protein
MMEHEIGTGALAVANRKIVTTHRAYHFVCPPAYMALKNVVSVQTWIREQANQLRSGP